VVVRSCCYLTPLRHSSARVRALLPARLLSSPPPDLLAPGSFLSRITCPKFPWQNWSLCRLSDGFLKDKASPEDTKRSCLSLQTDTGKKYGQLEVAGQKVPGKWVQMIMDNISRFVMITDYAMKGAPETVGLAWWGIKQVLNAVQNNYKLYGFFGSALGDITEMMVVIRTYDKLYDERGKSSWKASDMVNELFKHIRDVYQAILDFSYSVKKHLGAGKVGKYYRHRD
jgi:hypothetical protein